MEQPQDIIGLVEKTYGVKAGWHQSPANTQIGTTPTVLFKPDPKRLFFILINISNNTIFLALDSQVSATHGMQMAASGGVFIADWRDSLVLPSLEWHIVGIAADLNYYWLEVFMRPIDVASEE